MAFFMKHILLILLLSAVFLLSRVSYASVIFINSPNASSGGETVLISIDTEGKDINAVEMHLGFNPGEFQIKDVSDGGSIVNLWVQKPIFSNDAGTLDFSGIIPGGYTGTEGNVITIAIIPKQISNPEGFRVISDKILLNNGQGTSDETTVKNSGFKIESLAVPASPSSRLDTQAPDSFTPEIARDPNIFSGKYFLVFSATDQLSGIDRYEVMEVPTGLNINTLNSWQRAGSPYLLKDQSLSSDISVRAVDRSGNFRMVKIPAQVPVSTFSRVKTISYTALGFIAMVLLGTRFFR